MFKISYDTFLDKIHGCWYGKCLGGAGGAPVEGINERNHWHRSRWCTDLR